MGALPEQVTDRTSNLKFPLKKDGILQDGNLSQDATGEIRAKTEILAEGGVNSTPNTYISGDALAVRSSGPQGIFESLITGVKYQVPYQEIDKTGSKQAFQVDVQSEDLDQIRQGVFDTSLNSDLIFNVPAPQNEILNAINFKTAGDVGNFRFKVKSVATGNIILSYPDKFSYADNSGVDLNGSGDHKINIYYVDKSAPTRFLKDEVLEITMKWDSGNFLGTSNQAGVVSGDGVPYFAVDVQPFEFTQLLNEKSSVLDLSDFDTEVSNNPSVVASTDHKNTTSGNPHSVTKTEIGLSNVDNAQQIPLSQKGASNGVAELDASGKVPSVQLPASVMEYKGSYNIITNTPVLSDGIGTNGDFYKCSVSGSRDFGSGSITVAVGDALIYNDSTHVWEKIPSEDLIQSVNGKTGIVVLDTSDIDENGNLYYTESRVSSNADVSANTAKRSYPLADESKLDGIEEGAEVNVQSDWNQTDINADDYIKNKPHVNDVNFGAGYFASRVDTNIINANQFYKVDATFAPTKEVNIEWDAVNKRWEYTGADPAGISIFMSFTGAHDDGSTRYTRWAVYINGNPTVYPAKEARIESGDSMSVTVVVPYVEVSNGDYIELFTTLDSDNDEVWTSNLTFWVR